MKMFLDSAKTDEIRHALELWDVDGVTTNPRHVKESGKPFRTVIREIAELFAGTNKPVSVEVDPHLTDWKKMVAQGLELARISPNFVIKVSVSEQGFKAIRELSRQGVRVNATLIFSVPQAWQAARAGAAFVSPFLGWKEQHGDAAASPYCSFHPRKGLTYAAPARAACHACGTEKISVALTGTP